MPWFEVVVNSRWGEQFGLVLLQLTLQSKYQLFPENDQKTKIITRQISIGKTHFMSIKLFGTKNFIILMINEIFRSNI